MLDLFHRCRWILGFKQRLPIMQSLDNDIKFEFKAIFLKKNFKNIKNFDINYIFTQIRLISVFAVQTGTIATLLRNIPKQPLVFNDDTEKKHRREDEIIGSTWNNLFKVKSNDLT
ncbi:hypothetical protein BpHYR1_035240 [Brachionus plicatilis]|uniref:Uncharacterized protein n=1 Tax=Brachionus plicatilis TaxID=10195 RepID=A0A3M7R2K1_BRAPC|nr:hypothetical protein BpHYR1_035240 [Brachionus plicatilis]